MFERGLRFQKEYLYLNYLLSWLTLMPTFNSGLLQAEDAVYFCYLCQLSLSRFCKRIVLAAQLPIRRHRASEVSEEHAAQGSGLHIVTFMYRCITRTMRSAKLRIRPSQYGIAPKGRATKQIATKCEYNWKITCIKFLVKALLCKECLNKSASNARVLPGSTNESIRHHTCVSSSFQWKMNLIAQTLDHWFSNLTLNVIMLFGMSLKNTIQT